MSVWRLGGRLASELSTATSPSGQWQAVDAAGSVALVGSTQTKAMEVEMEDSSRRGESRARRSVRDTTEP